MKKYKWQDIKLIFDERLNRKNMTSETLPQNIPDDHITNTEIRKQCLRIDNAHDNKKPRLGEPQRNMISSRSFAVYWTENSLYERKKYSKNSNKGNYNLKGSSGSTKRIKR
jgi:hypothetical protein